MHFAGTNSQWCCALPPIQRWGTFATSTKRLSRKARIFGGQPPHIYIYTHPAKYNMSFQNWFYISFDFLFVCLPGPFVPPLPFLASFFLLSFFKSALTNVRAHKYIHMRAKIRERTHTHMRYHSYDSTCESTLRWLLARARIGMKSPLTWRNWKVHEPKGEEVRKVEGV